MTLPSPLIRIALIVLAALVLLKLSKVIAAPVVVAFMVGVVLSPVQDRAARAGIPNAASALTMALGAFLLILGGLILFAPVVEQIIADFPRMMYVLRSTLDLVLDFGRDLQEMQENVAAALGTEAGGSESSAELPSMMDAMMMAPALAAQALVFLGTLFFFLLTRIETYRWLADVLSGPGGAEATEALMRDADRSVSRYFLTITAINSGLGLLVALGAWAFGLPSAASWGVAAFLLNYLLYLGPTLFAGALLVAGHLNFFGIEAFLPAIGFVCLNFLEGYLVTPSLVGHRLSINPLVVFLTLTVGLWLWGVIGGIVALPLLVWTLAASGMIRWGDDIAEPVEPDPAEAV